MNSAFIITQELHGNYRNEFGVLKKFCVITKSMKFCVVGSGGVTIIKKFTGRGLAEDRKKPDIVVTYGGDGTILAAERLYPGVPKLPIRKSVICSRCKNYDTGSLDKIIEKLIAGDYEITEKAKLEAFAGGKKLLALNEIQVRSKKPYKALRFSVRTKDRIFENIIGDGIVVSTPYGSTAYYKTIGYEPFTEGIKLGFNNTNPKLSAARVKGVSTVTIMREDGIVIADNNPQTVLAKPGEKIKIRESDKKARFVEI